MDPFRLALLTVAPGAVCVVVGIGLMLREARRSGLRSRVGLRLNIVGLSLVFAVPGAVVIALVIGGQLEWPAVLGGLLGVAIGIANLSLVRWN